VESREPLNWLPELAIYVLPVLLLALLVYRLRRRDWRAPGSATRRLMRFLPWIFFAWFALGLTSCISAMGRIGAGDTEVPAIFLAGVLVAPLLWIAAILLRRRLRRPGDDPPES
jgi:hypothetical protein